MSRDVLTALDEAGIGIASATYELSRVAPVTVVREGRASGCLAVG